METGSLLWLALVFAFGAAAGGAGCFFLGRAAGESSVFRLWERNEADRRDRRRAKRREQRKRRKERKRVEAEVRQ